MYRLEISLAAHLQMRRLPAKIVERINQTIAGLSEQPRPGNSKKLTSLEGYRLRVGDYRILYTIDDKAQRIIIYRVLRRDEAYKVR